LSDLTGLRAGVRGARGCGVERISSPPAAQRPGDSRLTGESGHEVQGTGPMRMSDYDLPQTGVLVEVLGLPSTRQAILELLVLF